MWWRDQPQLNSGHGSNTMNKLPPQHWQHNGQTFTVSLFVEGDAVVGMTPVTTTGGIIVPPKKYLGDHVANGLSKMGVKPCNGCNKRKELLNGMDRGVRKLVGRG